MTQENDADALNEEHIDPNEAIRNEQEATNPADRTGLKAPVVNNEAPKPDETAEEKAKRVEAEAAAALAAKADEEAPKTLTDEEKEAAKKAEEEAAAEAAKTETEKLKAEDIAKGEYPVYNDAAADSVTAMLKEAGVTVEEAWDIFGAAAANQTPKDVDLTKLTAKVGKEKATLIMIGVQDFYNRNLAAVKETKDAVFAELGGDANYLRLQTWAKGKEEADPAFAKELDAYRTMLEAGKTPALLAMRELAKLYNADPKNKSLQITMTHGDKSGSENAGEKGLTRAEYLPLITAAEEKKDRAEIARLNALRTLGMKQGL